MERNEPVAGDDQEMQKALVAADELASEGAAEEAASKISVSAHKAQGRRMRINRMLMWRRHVIQNRTHKSVRRRVLTLVLVAFSIIFGLISGGMGGVYAYYQTQLPLLKAINPHALFQTTHIYDRNGHLLYELYDQRSGAGRRTYISYNKIPSMLIKATTAAEDRTFWTNNGVDFYGIGRAAVSNLEKKSIVEGGSTITQQLIKNQLFAEQARTLQVKSEEAILATGLTAQYPKWKIMEMYLNTVYYGDLNYGVEAAAEDYFGLQPQCTSRGQPGQAQKVGPTLDFEGEDCKPAVAQLDLAQASLLAGLPQSPSYFNPVTNRSGALMRQNTVLQSMLELGMITKQQASQASQEMQHYHFQSYASGHKMLAPHFVRYLIDQVLVPLLGAHNLADGGYSIYTTLDLDLEQKVEEIVYQHLYTVQPDAYSGYNGPLNITNNVNNGAAIVMNPTNGELLAMDGSAKYDGNTPEMQGQDNAAVAMRQPGSSFKPIVYATAFEMGWYPAMIVPDHKTIYPRKTDKGYYTPQNYDEKFHSDYPMTIRTALANSFNIPAIDTLMYAGIPNVQNMAGRLGLSEVANLPQKTLGPSMAIGSKEVTLLHLTGAYATFANGGIRVPPVSILEIKDNVGNVIYKYDEAHPQGIRALGADVAYLVNSVLSDKQARYHEFSPGNPLELDRPAAAKTGTTDSFRDNWTIGYTPYLAAGVWAGNSDNTVMNKVIGITGAGPIWHDIMEYASDRYNLPPNDFSKPDNVYTGNVSAQTGLQPQSGESTVTDLFIDGTLPTIAGDPTSYPKKPTAEPSPVPKVDKRPLQTSK